MSNANMVSSNYFYLITVIRLITGIRKLSTEVESNPKAPFSIATTPRFKGRRYSFPRIDPLYP